MTKEKFKEWIEECDKMVLDEPAFYNFKKKYSNTFVKYNKKYLYIHSIFYDCGLICILCDMFDCNDNCYTFLKYQLIYFSGKSILYDNNKFEEISKEDYIFKINTILKEIKQNIYNKYETK